MAATALGRTGCRTGRTTPTTRPMYSWRGASRRHCRSARGRAVATYGSTTRCVHRAAPRPRTAPTHTPARAVRQVHGHTVPRCALPFLSGAASNASVFVLSHFHASQASHPANLTTRVRDQACPLCRPRTAPRARASVRTHHVERPRWHRARRRAQHRRPFHLRVDAVGRARAAPRHVAAGRPSRQQEVALSQCCVRPSPSCTVDPRGAARGVSPRVLRLLAVRDVGRAGAGMRPRSACGSTCGPDRAMIAL